MFLVHQDYIHHIPAIPTEAKKGPWYVIADQHFPLFPAGLPRNWVATVNMPAVDAMVARDFGDECPPVEPKDIAAPPEPEPE
jgi:hypothetical protein